MIKLKKAITILFVIVYLLSVSPLINRQMSVKASQTTWVVDASLGDTIQEAINNASSGATIFVCRGTYYENVFINKSVSLVGEDMDSTIVYGTGNGSVVSIVADDVNFTGFTVKKSGANAYDNAIRIEHSCDVAITHNKMTENTNGISLNSSSNNVISNNIIFYNEFNGVYLFSSGGNVFSGNVISNNFQGVYLTFSSNDTFYRNNFNNTNQVISDSTNFWNYNGEGNYWSDYTGQDLKKDGIGDIPYLIDVNNQDNYPLMGLFSDFNVSFKGEIYYVSIISNSTVSNFEFKIGAETGNKIILFSVDGKEGTVGFCRVIIPTEFMDYPFIVLVDGEEVILTILGVSNATYSYLYFTYVHSSHNITIISSVALHLYSELLNQYVKLQGNLQDLNVTYYVLLNDYYALLNNYSILLGNYSQLQRSSSALNSSYQEHLLEYSENAHNLQNLIYIFAGITAIFIITTIYLSKRAHARITTKSKEFEGE